MFNNPISPYHTAFCTFLSFPFNYPTGLLFSNLSALLWLRIQICTIGLSYVAKFVAELSAYQSFIYQRCLFSFIFS